MQPAPDKMVTANVRLVRQIGAGGMGSVWLAEHTGLGTQVAVKFTSADAIARRPALVERFKREAAIAAKVKSPHALQVYDHGVTAEGAPYIVMELLEGETLRQRLLRETKLGLRHTALVVSQVAQVLSRAHKLGIIHRDIKPSNIFLIASEYELFVKVLDFGIAKQADLAGDVSTTETGTVMGSPLYMSPEQFLDAKDVDARADLWSLAVVAFHALVGQPPFPGQSMGQVLMAAMDRKAYRKPSELDGSLAPAFDGWFARAFAPAIAERFQTAAELAHTFVAVANEALGPTAALSRTSTPSVAALIDDVDMLSDDDLLEASRSSSVEPSEVQTLEASCRLAPVRPEERTPGPAALPAPSSRARAQQRTARWLYAASAVGLCVAALLVGARLLPATPGGSAAGSTSMPSLAPTAATEQASTAAASSSGPGVAVQAPATLDSPSATAPAALPTSSPSVPSPSSVAAGRVPSGVASASPVPKASSTASPTPPTPATAEPDYGF